MVEVAECWPNGRIESCQVHDIMRDICLKKCKDVRFLNTRKVSELDWESILANSDVNERRRRCAVYLEEGYVASRSRAIEDAQYLRALLTFSEDCPSDWRRRFRGELISDIKKFFPLIRVLDLQGVRIREKIPIEIGQLIHLKYLSIRYASLVKYGLPSGFWDLEYLVTLDLRSVTEIRLCNKFKEMKSLRHLYLPYSYIVEGGEKLTFRVECMETLKNFNPQRCQGEDLLGMKRLRIFTIRSGYYIRSLEELKGLSSVIKSGLLMNTLHMNCLEQVIDEEDPTILTSLLEGLTKLTFKGSIKSNNARFPRNGMEVFPRSLTHVRIEECCWGEEVSSALAFLPHLEFLQLSQIYFPSDENIMSFPYIYPKLKTLHMISINKYSCDSWEWKVDDGVLPNLQSLVFSRVNGLVKVPDNLVKVPKSLRIQFDLTYIRGGMTYSEVKYTTPRSLKSRS